MNSKFWCSYSLLIQTVNTCVPLYKNARKVSKEKPLASRHIEMIFVYLRGKKVQVGKDQEKAQSEKDSHSKNRGGKITN